MALLVKDPVCGMDVDPMSAAGRSEHGGTVYYFCSEGCKQQFDADPAKFAGASTEPLPPSEGRPKRWWEFWR
jgi:Cu+-exporting ATPase